MAEQEAPDRKRDERVKLRDLPPVAPVRWPERLSMTLLRHLNRCPRAGYLYVATGGAAPTAEMDRGTLAHAAQARIMVDWIRGREEDYAGKGDEELSSMTAEVVREVAREMPELWLSHEQRDIARICAFHFALGCDVKPADVVGVERKFALDLSCGWTISGIIDLAYMPDNESAGVDDYKTTLHVPPFNEWDPFQQKLYAAMLSFGYPLDREDCERCNGRGTLGGATQSAIVEPHPCQECKGRGYVEVPGAPIGRHLLRVTGREVFPRRDPRRRHDGKMVKLERTWSRMELMELVQDMEDLGERLSEMLETWKFPARYGTQACNECPAEALCPIPRGYRRFAGHIQTEEQAREAWAWAQRTKKLVGVTEGEVKEFVAVKALELEVGDEIWTHEVGEQRKLKSRGGRADWEGLEAAVTAAAEEGEPFDLRDWITVSNVSRFSKKKVVRGDGGAEAGAAGSGRDRGAGDAGGGGGRRRGAGTRGQEDSAAAEQRRDERYGADAPY